MRIRNNEDLRQFENALRQCRKPVWVVTPSGKQYNLKDEKERAAGLSSMMRDNDYDEPEVFTCCIEDEMLIFGYIEEYRKRAA